MRHMNWADKLIPWPLWDSFAERALAPKSKDASLIPRTHRTDGENRSRSFDFLYAGCASHTHKYTTELNVKKRIIYGKTYSNILQPQSRFYKDTITCRRNVSPTQESSPSVGLAGWSLLMAVWMLLKEAGGPHCCNTPMALQNWSASLKRRKSQGYKRLSALRMLRHGNNFFITITSKQTPHKRSICT